MNDAKIDTKLTQEEIEILAQRQPHTRFDNEGREVVQNRAARRKRPATDSKYTKNNHSQKIKKLGKKKARK